MTIKRLNLEGLAPQIKQFRGEQYFDQLLRAGWIFELQKRGERHPTLEIIKGIRTNCDELIENQNAQTPISGAGLNRVSMVEVIEQIADPFWWVGFFVLNILLLKFVSLMVAISLTFLVLATVAFFRAFRRASHFDKDKKDLQVLKKREAELRKLIEGAVEEMSTRPFVITYPHLKILFQPITLPVQSVRRWDQHMLKLAHQNTESLFIDLSDKIPPFEG